MQQMVFINLPTTDVARARAFYAGLGYRFDERFCDASSLFVGVSDTIHLMLLDRERFASFAPRPVAPEGTVGALVCLSMADAGQVDAFVARSVSDPDGNVLEVMWMDVDAAMRAWGQAA